MSEDQAVTTLMLLGDAQMMVAKVRKHLEAAFWDLDLVADALLIVAKMPNGETPSKILGMPPFYYGSNISYILNNILCSGGYLKKRRGRDDKRNVLYALTDKGLVLKSRILEVLGSPELKSLMRRGI